MTLELTKGAALLLALCYLDTFIRRYLARRIFCQEVSLGLLFGSICIIGMMTPIKFPDGVIFDARSVVIAVAGLFGGPICGSIAAILAAAYRYSLGGAGALIGVGVIVTSLAAGLLYRYGRARYGWTVGARQLFVFGIVLNILCVSWFIPLPGFSTTDLIQNIALPFVVVLTPMMVFLGWLIRDAQMQIEIADDLKATSEALGESERCFRAIIDHSPNGITLKDTDSTFLVVNETYARWQNMDVKQIIGKKLSDVYSPDQIDEIISIDHDVISEGKIITGERFRDFADGVRRDVQVTKIPITLAAGDKQVVLTIITDITEIKKSEIELRRAYEEAVAANRTKSDFLARMSHEFRTPLNAILGFSDVLRHQHLGDRTNDRAIEYANDIHISADLLLELVDDLLDISAIESGRITVEYEFIDVPALLDECMRTIKWRLSNKNISTKIQIPDNTVPLSADRRALKQILLNLLTNAIKFTPAGGHITLELVQTENETNIVVSDTGPGIEAELREKLLSPDAVPAINTQIAQEGWGLGLSIVRGLTELHGGQINIECNAQQGTDIAVMLPNEHRACA